MDRDGAGERGLETLFRAFCRIVSERAGSTVVVFSHRDGQKENLALKVNGKAEAGTDMDVSTQLLLSHIPLLLHPASERALIVGLGSGMSAAAAARHPSIQRVDVVEISPEVVAAARLFAPYNDRVQENQRVRIVIDDDATGAAVNRKLVEAGIDVHRLEPERVSLERRFLEITSRLESVA